jgi:hypothetical protein
VTVLSSQAPVSFIAKISVNLHIIFKRHEAVSRGPYFDAKQNATAPFERSSVVAQKGCIMVFQREPLPIEITSTGFKVRLSRRPT